MRKMYMMPAAAAFLLLIGGCNRSSSSGAKENDSLPSFADYIGKYPSNSVGGVSFWRNPLVKKLVHRAVRNHKMARIILSGGVETPIADMEGDGVVANACEPHNCSDHNWSVAYNLADYSASNVCYYDAAGPAGRNGRYFPDGKFEPIKQTCS